MLCIVLWRHNFQIQKLKNSSFMSMTMLRINTHVCPACHYFFLILLFKTAEEITCLANLLLALGRSSALLKVKL